MRFLTTLGLIALTVALLSPAVSAAQYWQNGAPSGSYVQTCRNIRTSGDTLEAICDTGSGNWTWTSLRHFDECTGGIENIYGRLECTKGGYYGQNSYGRNSYGYGYRQYNSPYGVLEGSYVETCSNIHTVGSTLVATCQRRDGSWRRSSLRYYHECSGSIENVNGWLACR